MLNLPRDGVSSNLRSSSPSSHSPALQYSYRMPSPPRLVIPPPTHDASGVPEFSISRITPADFESNGFENSEFLKTVTYGDFKTSKDSMLDWRYEQRRVAQKILPFLLLGPVSVARDREYLQQEGITMVMAVRNTLSAQAKLLAPKAPHDLGIDLVNIDVAGNQELIAAFPKAIEVVNKHLSAMYQKQQGKNLELSRSGLEPDQSIPGKVLIFCESGNERSAAVVAAYIMAMHAVDFVEAIQIVQARRFCACFDDSMRFLLKTYDAILAANRDVARVQAEKNSGNGGIPSQAAVGSLSGVVSNGSSARKSKRNLDDAYEDDVDMGEAGDMRDDDRFEKRAGYAPFEDDGS